MKYYIAIKKESSKLVITSGVVGYNIKVGAWEAQIIGYNIGSRM